MKKPYNKVIVEELARLLRVQPSGERAAYKLRTYAKKHNWDNHIEREVWDNAEEKAYPSEGKWERKRLQGEPEVVAE